MCELLNELLYVSDSPIVAHSDSGADASRPTIVSPNLILVNSLPVVASYNTKYRPTKKATNGSIFLSEIKVGRLVYQKLTSHVRIHDCENGKTHYC